MTKANARLARWFLIAMGIGCPALATPQEAPSPANSTAPTSASAPSQTESQPMQVQSQDQNEVQKNNSARSEADIKNQAKTKPARQQKPGNANSTIPNTRRHTVQKRATAPLPRGAPKKVVVREGGANEPTAQIVTGMTPEEADRLRRETELSLGTTAETLKEIAPRELDALQQETVSQIHNYMKGSRTALKEGDFSRAHTLALKAGLVAEDLARH